jgi:hypothetical protein
MLMGIEIVPDVPSDRLAVSERVDFVLVRC